MNVLSQTSQRKKRIYTMLYPRLFFAVLFCSVVISLASRSQDKTIVGAALQWYDFGDKKPLQISLPSELREISGITMTEDGRLFAHQDESGSIYQLDPGKGTIVKRFSIGKKIIREDFEDIAVVKNAFYLITSAGDLYEFTEGANEAKVDYKLYRTGLSRRYDIEGLCYDPATQALLIACKESPEKKWRGYRLIFPFSLSEKRLNPSPRFVLPLKTLERQAKHNVFKPSAIARHPRSGTFFILAAAGESLIEVSEKGEILNQVELRPREHPQPEGIAIAPNGSLFISNEGELRGTLTMYPMKQQPEKSSR